MQGADDSSWSDTEDEADRSSGKVKEGINTISGQKAKIAKVKSPVTLHHGQGAWVYLSRESEQVNGEDFIFPVLFNTIIEKNLFASKFSPRAGVLRSPAIYMINHTNDIFVQVKKGECVGKLISLDEERVQAACHQGRRSRGVSQLLCVGMLAVLGAQVMAENEFKVEAYNCSQPMNIKMFDREAHCKFNPEVEGVPQKVSILQHVNSQTVEGYQDARCPLTGTCTIAGCFPILNPSLVQSKSKH